MKLKCPGFECSSQNSDPESVRFVRKGRFFRKSDGQWIPRYRCPRCGRYFSSATFNACFMQKKRRLNSQIVLLLNSTVSQRRAAMLLSVNRKTVIRKFRFMAEQCRLQHQAWLKTIGSTPIRSVQFDVLVS